MLKKQLEYIRKITSFEPEIAIVLGSGLGELADEIKAEAVISYADIPDFPVSTVASHKGRYVLGYIGDRKVVIMQGRIHLYEGYSGEELAMPIRLMRKMGAGVLLLTNAAGGVNKGFKVGDFMLINDHISSFVPSALIGKNDDSIGTRFPDMTNVYSPRLNDIIRDTAVDEGIALREGVYIQFRGPCFETKAEIRMASLLGADAVGMSTAIDAQTGVHCGFEVCGISLITNMACGISENPLSDAEVTETASKVAPTFKRLVKEAVKRF